jgi:hypothetical protein
MVPPIGGTEVSLTEAAEHMLRHLEEALAGSLDRVLDLVRRALGVPIGQLGSQGTGALAVHRPMTACSDYLDFPQSGLPGHFATSLATPA